MAKKQLTLSIPTPCTEDWNAMTPDKNGKFCASCQKTVVDFSRFSDAELIDFFYDFKGSTCGRFDEKQVNRPIHAPFLSKSQNHWVWALSALLLPSVAASQTVRATEATEISPPSVLNDKIGKTNFVQHKIKEDSIVLSGIVVDEHNEVLAYSTVVLLEKPIGVIADTNGHFELKIHLQDIGYQDFVITASMVGYESISIKINPFDVDSDLKIVLKEGRMIMSGVTIHRNFFQRTKYRIKRFFYELRHK